MSCPNWTTGRTLDTLATPKTPAYESSKSFRVRCPGVLIQTKGFGCDLKCLSWLHVKNARESDERLAQDFSEHST
jgi:hypothetical protein